MAKSFWLKEQTGNFTNSGNDTFDESKQYIGIRLQQGVPLLDRDWNELEDIRRYQEMSLKRNYIGNGTINNGFEITVSKSIPESEKYGLYVGKGTYLVDGLEVTNTRPKEIIIDSSKLSQVSDHDVYLEVWVEEITSKEDKTLDNNKDVGMETCIRHMLAWAVKVTEKDQKMPDNDTFNHRCLLATTYFTKDKSLGVRDMREKIIPLGKSMTHAMRYIDDLESKLMQLENRITKLEREN